MSVQTPPVTKTPSSEKASSKSAFTCHVKKTCRDITTCKEANFHLKDCGNTSLDLDGDGIPCVSLCK
ncbi:MAG: excalibur calcium-binding domain-containing protein [Moraxellaceae bacterium]|nr:excalibur calcium-binding domain-containing protein [Moraxellaceae bacterium]